MPALFPSEANEFSHSGSPAIVTNKQILISDEPISFGFPFSQVRPSSIKRGTYAQNFAAISDNH